MPDQRRGRASNSENEQIPHIVRAVPFRRQDEVSKREHADYGENHGGSEEYSQQANQKQAAENNQDRKYRKPDVVNATASRGQVQDYVGNADQRNQDGQRSSARSAQHQRDAA